jgi:2',3'-cyclic-nucleotide 2'-phosphodiesterase (5'-nucleotidase family)
VDLGDVFWVKPDDIRNDFMLAGYAQIGCDAVVPADQEWAVGTRRLAALAEQAGTTLLSTTITGGAATTCPVVVRDLPGLRLAVVSDVPREVFRPVPPQRVAELTFADPSALARRVRQLKQDGFAVVVAAHVDKPYLAAEIAAVDADLFLGGHNVHTEPALLRVGGKPVVKVGGPDRVGALALKVRDGRITDIDYRAELVNEAWPIDARLLETYQAYAHAAMREALDAERKEGLEYMASEACGRCHLPQYESWAKTNHARAWTTLTKVRRTGDPACVMCHTSGFGTEKGFYTIEKTPQFANCHRCSESAVDRPV